jgi:3-oxoacyl-[acyl-carrier protein] reductase
MARKKKVLVTGSGSGIGREIALTMALQGFVVGVNDIIPDKALKVIEVIKAQGGEAVLMDADISQSDRVKEMFAYLNEAWGRLDVLVNNAGVPGKFSRLMDMPDETWHRTLDVHLNGTFYCLREASRMMVPAGSGRIINMASIAGLLGTVGSGEYGVAKAGVINLTKTAAKELAPFKITVNAIAPGMVATETNLDLKSKSSGFIETAEASSPTGQMTTPAEIAQLVLFLVSPAARNLTGQVITMDGGASINIGMDGFMQKMLTKKG